MAERSTEGGERTAQAKYWDSDAALATTPAEVLTDAMSVIPDWMTKAECINSPVDFFDKHDKNEAKLVCSTCPFMGNECEKYEGDRQAVAIVFHVINGEVARSQNPKSATAKAQQSDETEGSRLPSDDDMTAGTGPS